MGADVLLGGLGILFLNQLATSAILVSTGDDFVSAVRKFGHEGGQVELQLDTAAGAISVANATWNVGVQQQGFNGGTLLITAAPSMDGKPAVLDAAMKSGLSPEATDPTVQIWRDIVFINLCSKELDNNPSVEDEGFISIDMYLMPRSMVKSRVQRRDTVVYITYREFSSLVYWMTLDTSPFRELQKYVRRIYQVDWKSEVDVAHLGVFSMTVDFWSAAGGEDFNVTFRATNNPRDPLGFMLPEFGGSLMPHRLCAVDGNSSGQFLPEEVVNPSISFLWMVDGSAQLRDALRSMSQSKLPDQRFGGEDPVAIATILDDVSVADGGDVLEQILLHWDVLLNGPPSLRRPILDFADREGVLTMENADVDIFIRNLKLRGLKSTAVLNEDGTASTRSTSLQLAAIAHKDRPLLQMHGVTLEVAKPDFLCLLSAARRGTQWKSRASADAHLLEPITWWKPATFNRSLIEFEEYRGWGIEGKDIQFVSATPVLDSDLVLAPRSQGDTDKVALGVGIAVGVGGVLLLIAVLYGLAVVRKRCPSREGNSSHSNEDKEAQTPSSATEQEEEEGQMGSSMKLCDMKMEICKPDSIDVVVAGGQNKSDEIQVLADTMPLPVIIADQGGGRRPSNRRSISVPQLGAVPQMDASPHELVHKEVASLHNLKSDDVLRLQDVIGKGAWGTVYKGTWKGLTVAVKTVLFTRHSDDKNRPQKARAILEAAVSTSLSHPNIVSTYHYDIRPVGHNDSAVRPGLQVESMTGVVDDWKLYLVLEYCHFTLSYATAANFLHRGEKPLVDMILHLLLDMAKGMLYLHDHKIIHGDLKPENVLLKVDDESGLVAKITDFGLSINLGPTATHVSNISTGTPFYCAPEVPQMGRATQASDVFSFGVVMAEVCSKTPPWKCIKGEFHYNPEFPNFGFYMPRALQHLTMRCLQLDLTKRPRFQEIVSTLESLYRVSRAQEPPRYKVAR